MSSSSPQLVANADRALPARRRTGPEPITRGVGLGLAIVDSITRAHDGTLTLTPRPGGGLCASVLLRAAPPEAAG